MSEEACSCHGEAMRFVHDRRYDAGGFWRCRVKDREGSMRSYWNLSGVGYNRRLLKQRRRKALARQRRRNSTGEMASG